MGKGMAIYKKEGRLQKTSPPSSGKKKERRANQKGGKRNTLPYSQATGGKKKKKTSTKHLRKCKRSRGGRMGSFSKKPHRKKRKERRGQCPLQRERNWEKGRQ